MITPALPVCRGRHVAMCAPVGKDDMMRKLPRYARVNTLKMVLPPEELTTRQPAAASRTIPAAAAATPLPPHTQSSTHNPRRRPPQPPPTQTHAHARVCVRAPYSDTYPEGLGWPGLA